MNYRKFYAEQTGLPVPKDFDIHHLDGNRDNNSISNLVAIPKKLHHQYHWYKNQVSLEISEGDLIPRGYTDGGKAFLDYFVSRLVDFKKPFYEVGEWVDYRNYLLGDFVNTCEIHNYKKADAVHDNNR